MSWSYAGTDPGIGLFSAALAAGAPMPITPTMRVLEVGCCEADWLHDAHRAWPETEFVGVDWRAPNVVDGDGKVTRRQGNGLDPDLFPPNSFDAAVSLSAIEHFGLGHYARDPQDPNGDTQIVSNIWRWLKPGAWLYFDVPYDPTDYRVMGTECRVYDDYAITARLKACDLAGSKYLHQWREVWRGWARATRAAELIAQPTVPDPRFYYVAMVWRKLP